MIEMGVGKVEILRLKWVRALRIDVCVSCREVR